MLPPVSRDGEDDSGGTYKWLATEFMVGDSILVAPIIYQHETANPPTSPVRPIYLPQGENGQTQWYAFQNDQNPLPAPVDGGTTVESYYAPLGEAESGSDAYYYNDNIKTTYVKVFDDAAKIQVVALF